MTTNLLAAGRPTHRTAEHVQPAIEAMRETVRLNVDIPKQEYKELKRRAVDEDTTISAIVKQALQQYSSTAPMGEAA
jgi:hypothetical protein